MKLVSFTSTNTKEKIYINPTAVSSIQNYGNNVLIRHGGGDGCTIVDYSGVTPEKAIWYATETLRLGYHPYASSDASKRDDNWARNGLKETL